MDDEETLYPLCPHRNVPAAYQCFFGQDSRGIERFFGHEHTHWPDGAYLIAVRAGAYMRQQGRWTLAGVLQSLRWSAAAWVSAITTFNPALTTCWMIASSALSALNSSAFSALGRLSARRSHRRNAAALLGTWARHYRRPILLASRTLARLPA
jgi:hypothetical protein